MKHCSKGHKDPGQEPPTCTPTENMCTALGSLPTGYSGLDIACTKVTACGDGRKACAAGYNGAVSSRACPTNTGAFDAFTGCTGMDVVDDSHGGLALKWNAAWVRVWVGAYQLS